MYTLIGTAKLNVLDPELYLEHKPGMTYRIGERSNADLENPSDVSSLDSVRQRTQRIMLAAIRSKTRAEPQELRFKARRPKHNHRDLDNLVLHRGNARKGK